MSSIWADFDPLSRSRAKPAAPVTSIEQVNAVPVNSQSAHATKRPESKLLDQDQQSKNMEDRKDKSESKGSIGTNDKAVIDQAIESNDKASDTEKGSSLKTDANQLEASDKVTDKESKTDNEHEITYESTKSSFEETGNGDISETRSDTSLSEPSNSGARSKTRNDETSSNIKSEDAENDNGDATSGEPKNDEAKNGEIKNGEIKNEETMNEEAKTQDTESEIAKNDHTENSNNDAETTNGIVDKTDNSELTEDAVIDDEKLYEPDTAESPEPNLELDTRRPSIEAMKELGERTEQAFDYQKFMTNLRSKPADPIARYIKSFLQEFHRGVWTPTQQERIVSDFYRFISVKLRDHEPFASMSKQERRNSMEGVEKLVTNRLYNRIFPPVMAPILRTDGHSEDLLRDQIFEKKMRLWGWVEGRHLDINEKYLESTFTKLAQTELGKLHQFKSPRDKMICVLNCSKVIFALIRQAQLEQNADSFLPLLIFVVLKCYPINLVSTIKYIQRFRAKEYQQGETAYYLSTLESAVTFISTLDRANLTISDAEFEDKMNDSIQAETIRVKEQRADEEISDRHTVEGESSAAVLTASANLLVEQFKTFTTKFLEDLSPQQQQQQQRQQQLYQNDEERRYRHDERAARAASREDYAAEQTIREQFNETLGTLENMFPSLDKDVIADVLEQNGPNVGSAVDICLALVN